MVKDIAAGILALLVLIFILCLIMFMPVLVILVGMVSVFATIYIGIRVYIDYCETEKEANK